jgi:PAS domain-containing protein
VDALISQTRRLKGDVDAVRRDTPADGSDPRGRWQRALYDLALYQLDDLDQHLAQLRDGPPPVPVGPEAVSDTPSPGSLLSRVGSAEWNLRTDEARWSAELCHILGRDPAAPPLTLDELPSVVADTDRPKLTTMVTDCLVDARPVDGEFRVVRPDGEVRTVHMMGEPVLAADGSTVSMWAVLRDVSELRRRRRAVSETRDSLPPRGNRADTEHGLAVEPWGAVPPRHGSPRLPHRDTPGLDLAAHHLPATTSGLAGGDWYDTLGLPDGETLLGVGDLAGHGVAVTSGVAMLLGAVRGMAMAGTRPGRLLDLTEQLLRASAQPDLTGAVCCRYRPETRTLVWAHAGRPAPLLFRAGTGRALTAPDGDGATAHAQAEEPLQAGDLLLLHTDGLLPGSAAAAVDRLLGLAPRLARAEDAQGCVRVVAEEFGGTERETGACVLVARVTS